MIGDPALRQLFAVLPEARVVGGAVRDHWLGHAMHDVDLAVGLPPDQVMARLRQAGIKVVPTGIAHGTVTAVVDGVGFEITSLRRDVATDGRHAKVEFTDDWAADAARRDFTINALSMAADGTLFDYCGGLDDLRAGRVRFVGDASARVAEDYLRILRFFRFFARFGRGQPDADAVAAIRAGIDGLRHLSAERVWHELKALLAVALPYDALDLMRETGVLAVLLPRGADPARVRRLGPATPLLRFAALADEAVSYAVPLRLSKTEAAELAGYAVAPPPLDASDDDLRRALEETAPAALIGASRLRGDPQEFQARLAALPRPVFPLQGRDALALGAKPGEAMGLALAAVREWWRAGGCVASAAECRRELARRLGR